MIKRIVKIAFVLAFLALVFIAITNIIVVNSTQRNIISDLNDETFKDKKYDCIVVLGAGIKPDGRPSDMLKDRLDTAISAYNMGKSEKILLTGDHGQKHYDEVNAMRDYMISKGIPDEVIYLDHAGFSTYDSMYRLKEVFCTENALVVTQKYHLYRALYIAESFGIDAYGISADKHIYSGQKARDAREILARSKDFVSCIIKVKPKFLGEKIDIQTSLSAETHG